MAALLMRSIAHRRTDGASVQSGAGAVQTGPPTCVQCSQTGKAFSLTVDVEDDTLVLLHAPRTGKHDLAKKSGKYIHLKCISVCTTLRDRTIRANRVLPSILV